MQWDDSTHAGFTDGEPWIKVNPNYKEINVKQQLQDPDSIFHYYQSLIRLRKNHLTLMYGTYDLLLEEHPQIYAYTRTLDDEVFLIVLNFSGDTPHFELPEHLQGKRAEWMLGNYEAKDEGMSFTMRPYEARVYRLTKQ